MPRDSSGNYTTPAGQPVTAGTTIDATIFNNLVADIVAELTDSLSRSGKGSLLQPLELADGTVGAPSLTFGNEPSSGLFRDSAGVLRISVLGTYRLDISATGASINGDVSANSLKTALIDNPGGTIGIGLSTATTITIGRTGQIVTFPGNITHSGSDPASTTAFSDTTTPMNVVKAWARLNVGNAGAVTVAAGFNVASASYTTSTISIVWAQVFGNANYCLISSSGGGSTFVTDCPALAITASTGVVSKRDYAGTLANWANNDVCYVMALGAN